MKKIFAGICLLVSSAIYAQQIEITTENNKLKITETYVNGNLKSISYYTGKKLEIVTKENFTEQIDKGKLKLDGNQKKFHENGKLKSECTYNKGKVMSNSCKNFMKNGEQLYSITDTPPEFKDGNQRLMEIIQNETKNSLAKYKGVIYVSFIVDKFGNIQEVKAFRGGDIESKTIAEKIVQNLGQFKPATQKGEAVNCVFNLPIKFE